MTHNIASPILCAMLLLLAACNAPPGLDAGSYIPPSNHPIELLPLDGLLAQTIGGTATETSADALAARAARLRARAAAN